MNTRQRRYRQKARTKLARTTAQLQKPQMPRRIDSKQVSRKSNGVSKLSRLATNKPSTEVGAGITPLPARGDNVRSFPKRSKPQTPETRARVKREALGLEQRPVSSAYQMQASKKPRGTRAKSSTLIYGMRLLILGVGIGAIAGTLMAAWDPISRQPTGREVLTTTQVQQVRTEKQPFAALSITQEILPLKAQLQTLAEQKPKLQAGMFLLDLDTGAYIDLDATSIFPSASTIKLPILLALFQDIDAGKVSLDEKLTLKPEIIGSGSGNMQYQKPGTQFTVLDTVTKMITISDNTATNMLISRLGGAEVLNQRFRSWGLTTTTISNPLPDLEGTNTTSPKELGTVMFMINQADVVSAASRDRMLDILRHTSTNTLLPHGLGAGATIAHKTGDIGSLVADVGLIEMPIGKRYIAAVMVKRPHNDPSAQELIRQLSRVAYSYLSQPVAIPSTNASPLVTAGTIGTTTH